MTETKEQWDTALIESAAEALAREIHSAEKWDEDTITLPIAVARALAAHLRTLEALHDCERDRA